VALAALGRDHDNRYSLRVFHAGQLFYEFQTIHGRHIDIAENEIHFLPVQDRQSLQPVAGFEDLTDSETCLSQGTLYDFSHDGRIIHDEHGNSVHDLHEPPFLQHYRR
jgi:hypothetical protein